MCDFILYFNDYVLHLCVINDDDYRPIRIGYEVLAKG